MKLSIIIIITCLLSVACTPTWKYIDDKPKLVKLDRVSFSVPKNWVFFNDHNNTYAVRDHGKNIKTKVERILMTKNGFSLDVVDIIKFELNKAFPNINKKADETLLISELAELWIAEQKVALRIEVIEILKNQPINFEKQQGFLVHYRYNDAMGKTIENLSYGFVTKEYFYTFTYQAPSLHFFDASLSDFKGLISSISLKS